MSKIKNLSYDDALNLIGTPDMPRGLFLVRNPDYCNFPFTAIDNSTGDCWVEDFHTEDNARAWLNSQESEQSPVPSMFRGLYEKFIGKTEG